MYLTFLHCPTEEDSPYREYTVSDQHNFICHVLKASNDPAVELQLQQLPLGIEIVINGTRVIKVQEIG